MQEAVVFIVRLWRAVATQHSFRAAVLRAGTDESAWFTDARALAHYLEHGTDLESPAPDGAESETQRREAR